jgi:predicted O-linked N-acetylglucosamine transferase (SPINDLY family)
MNEHYQRALNLLGAGQWDEARHLYEQLLRGYDDVKYVLNDLGVTFFYRNSLDRALAYYDAALLVDPGFPTAHQNRGNALMQLGRTDDAIASFYRAMETSDDKSWVLQVGHQILTKLTELDRKQDIETYWRTISERFRGDAGILHNYANHLQEAHHQYSRAIAIYEGLEGHPQADLPQLYNDWAIALKGQGLLAQGRQRLRQALALRPFHPLIYSNMLFDALYEPDLDADEILEMHKGYETTQAIEGTTPFVHEMRDDGPRRLRIGYLSSDFRYHSIAVFSRTVFQHHDPDRFELFAYYNGSQQDAYTEEFQKHAHAWRVVDGMHPTEAARLIHDDEVDILVDLNGHTRGNLLPALLYKPAPLQMAWLGHVHSLGLSAVDYFITDAVADPPGLTESQFVEKLLRLPTCFLCFSPYDNPPDILDTPALRNGFVTFGLVGNFAKINPFMVGLYAGAMKAVPGSRCLVKSSGMADLFCCRRLEAMFAAEGISRDRLVFRRRTDDTDAYLRTFHEIDVLFDFYPFNGETISCAAFQMGTPMVSLFGTSHRSRAGLSLLSALGHPEWAAQTKEAFIEAAIGLTRDIGRLDGLHRGLRREFLASPLCDGPAFTRGLEAAYRGAWETYIGENRDSASNPEGKR